MNDVVGFWECNEMTDAITWLFGHLVGGIVNIFRLFTPTFWQEFPSMEWTARLIYYGGSAELFFVVIDLTVIVLLIGLWKRRFLWGVVSAIEAVNNTIGRFAAWAALLMVIQQVLIVAIQRIFRLSEISVGPFGFTFTRDISWFAEELKLYNAMIVALCAAYTFIQGGHVRVDILYSKARYRTKRYIDMFGSLFFILPFMTIVWLFGWSFMWRHLITPKVATTNTLDQLLAKTRIMKWNVETIGFSPNGFDGYFLFKILLVGFAGLMFLQGVAFFYRNLLELIEGPEAHQKNLDRDADREASALKSLVQAKSTV